MELTRVFRLQPDSRIAFVGSGGKTSAMFQLARAYPGRVLLTTTTHLGKDQLGMADSYQILSDEKDLPRSRSELDGRVVLVAGPADDRGRVGALDPRALKELHRLADEWGCPLLVEADGARKLPLKAPAAHEPAVPEFCTGVVVCVGLSGLGERLDASWVHRPDRFAEVSGLEPGERIEIEALVRVLTSPDGSLKGLPEDATRLLLINQIDAFPNWRALKGYLPALLAAYHSVIFGTLEGELILEVQERIAGIVLAAGGSSRYGRSKQFLDWKGKPFIVRAAEAGLKAGLDPVVVVTGADRKRAAEELKHLDVQVVPNLDWESGQSTSVRAGVAALPEHLGGAVFLLVDQPQIPPEVIRDLVAQHARQLSAITALQINQRRAHPVLFDRLLFTDLLHLQGDAGGRLLFDQHQVEYLPHADQRLGIDVDSPGDYDELKKDYGQD